MEGLLVRLRQRQNGRHLADNIFNCIFLNENAWIAIKIRLKFISKGPINNMSALVQIMTWCCASDKPLPEAMMISLLMHICITQPQWDNMAITILCSSSSISWLLHYRLLNSDKHEYINTLKFIIKSHSNLMGNNLCQYICCMRIKVI